MHSNKNKRRKVAHPYWRRMLILFFALLLIPGVIVVALGGLNLEDDANLYFEGYNLSYSTYDLYAYYDDSYSYESYNYIHNYYPLYNSYTKHEYSGCGYPGYSGYMDYSSYMINNYSEYAFYSYEGFVDVYIITNPLVVELGYFSPFSDESSFSIEHYKTVWSSIENVFEIKMPYREGYTLVDWVGTGLGGYENYDFSSELIILNTSWVSEHYYSALVVPDTSRARVFAVFYPSYTPITPFDGGPPFIITFNPTGGTAGDGQDQRTTQTVGGGGTTGILGVGNMPTPPTKGGVRFMHWTFDPDGFGQVFTGTQGITSDITVFAQWGYEVRFFCYWTNLSAANRTRVIQSGNFSANTTPSWVPHTGLRWPSNPTRAGFVFDGWYTEIEGGQRVDANTIVTGGKDLFTRWILNPAVTVNFNPMGGTPAAGHSLVLQAIRGMSFYNSRAHGLNAGFINNGPPHLTHPSGYNIVSWWPTPAGPDGSIPFAPHNNAWAVTGGAPHFRGIGTVTYPFTLYAHFVRRIAFDLNHPTAHGTFSGGLVDIPITAPANSNIQDHGAWVLVNGSVYMYGVMPTPREMPGHTFVGWFSTPDPAGGTQLFVDTDISTFPWQNPNQRRVYGRWIADASITVTLNANGGCFDGMYPPEYTITQRSIPRNASPWSIWGWYPQQEVNEPTRPGYVFMGYYYTPDGPFSPLQYPAPTDRSYTVYARWAEATTITFIPLGATTNIPVVHYVPRGFTPYEWIAFFIYDPYDNSGGGSPNFMPFLGGLPGTPSPPVSLTAVGSPPAPNQSVVLGWNTAQDLSGSWWAWQDFHEPFGEPRVYYNAWRTAITFDRNHRYVYSGAPAGTNHRMTINIPIGHSLADRHEHHFFNIFSSIQDRRIWITAPDYYTWRPVNNNVPTVPNQLPILGGVAANMWALYGWNSQADGLGQWFDINQPRGMNEGRTYFAIWRQRITFLPGLAPYAVIPHANRSWLTAFPAFLRNAPAGINLTPIWPGPVGEVPRFHVWNSLPDASGTTFAVGEMGNPLNPGTEIIGPQTIYATWTADVTFVPNAADATGGGTLENAILGRPVGGGFAQSIVARPNWIFVHWNMTQNGSGASFVLGNLVNSTRIYNMTRVYAQWDGIVTFEPNGGALHYSTPLEHRIRDGRTIAASICPSGTSWEWVWDWYPYQWPGGMPETPIHPDGHTFEGWFWEDDYGDWHEFTATTPMTMGHVTVYARWRYNTLEFIKTNAALYETPRVIQPLNGAVFVLEIFDEDYDEWVYAETSQPSGDCGIPGRVSFDTVLLNEMGFRLREVIAPSNYNLPPGHWEFEMAYDGSGILGGPNGIVFYEIYGVMTNRGEIFDFIYIDGEGWHVGNVPTRNWSVLKTDWNLYTNENHAYLPGAEFALFVYNGYGIPGDMLVIYNMVGPGFPWTLVETQTSDVVGTAGVPMLFPMMPGRVYQLVETVAPLGYQLPPGQWRIQVIASEDRPGGYRLAVEGVGSQSQPLFVGDYSVPGYPVYRVGNLPFFEVNLPLAGGSGTGTIMFVGAAFVLIALGFVVYMLVRKKRFLHI